MTIFSCKGEQSELLKDFYKLSPETVNFFESNVKVQCKCLEQESVSLNKLFSENKSFIEDLKTKKLNYSDKQVQEKLIKNIYPVLGAYNNCNADAPQPRPEVFNIIEKDVMNFAGISEPGNQNNKLNELNKELLKKNCSEEAFKLSQKLEELTIVISPVYYKQ